MKVKKSLIGSYIQHKGMRFLIEDTAKFKKIAKAYGFDVFEKATKKKKADKVEDARTDEK
jgi:hypothetical protein